MTFARLRAMAPAGYLATPQRPDFHLLLLPTRGASSHSVDFARHALAPGRSLWVRPGQVQRFADDDRWDGDLVLFRSDFLIPGTRAAAVADDRFGAVAIDHPPGARGALDAARRALAEEYTAATHAEILRHLLSVLILRLDADAPPATGPDPDELYVRFRDRLERDFAIAHDVAHYATALGYSSRTLNRATQRAIGRSPKQLIQDRVVLEARRLLAHTSLPVSTIAARLGFRDASNFAAFFLHQTAATPSGFRDEQRG
jgi:AraC-like DNA-binding protein